MKLFVGKDPKGYVRSIVASQAQCMAEAYWQGQNYFPFTVEEINLDDVSPGCVVMPILNTRVDLGTNKVIVIK